MNNLKLVALDESFALLTLRRYSSKAIQRITRLPTKWNGTGWIVPRKELRTIVETLLDLGLDVDEALKPPDTERKELAPIDAPTDYQFKTAPFNHQTHAFLEGRPRVYFALFMEMGTGKSKTAIDLFSYWMQQGKIDCALIVAPRAVLRQWVREIETHSPLPPEKRRTVLLDPDCNSTVLKAVLEQFQHVGQFFVMNYERLEKLKDELERLFKRRHVGMCLDESTEIKGAKSQVTKAARYLGKWASRRLIMSGSPITQGPEDSFSQFAFLEPSILGHQTISSFRAEFMVTLREVRPQIKDVFARHKVVGYNNLDRLNKAIAANSFRVLKADCLDLPPKVYRRVEVPLTDEQLQLYHEMRDEAVVQVEGHDVAAPIVLTQLLRLHQITGGNLPLHDEFGQLVKEKELHCFRYDVAREVAQEAFESQQKVIIWCAHRKELERLSLMPGLKDECVVYHGSMSGKLKDLAVQQFMEGDAQVFIAMIQAGGIGLQLHKASTEIYFSCTFSYLQRIQSEDRAHRHGQTRSVTIVDLFSPGTVDEAVLEALSKKKDLADIITGDSLRRLLGAA